MLRLIRPAPAERLAPSAAIARARLQHALSHDRPRPGQPERPAHAAPPGPDDLLGRLLAEIPASDGRPL